VQVVADWGVSILMAASFTWSPEASQSLIYMTGLGEPLPRTEFFAPFGLSTIHEIISRPRCGNLIRAADRVIVDGDDVGRSADAMGLVAGNHADGDGQ